MTEIRRIATEMGIKSILFPDTSGVVNSPMDGTFHMYPKGGAPIEEIRSAGDSIYTIALGRTASLAAAKLLDTKCKVPFESLDLPIGIRATDTFVDNLRRIAGVSVPESIMTERGQLIDVLTDMHQYLYGKKVAIVGDPDHLVSLTQFLTDMDMDVRLIVTGTPAGPKFSAQIKEFAGEKAVVKDGLGSDMFGFHQLI